MSLIWPSETNPRPGAAGRLGRMLHWLALILAGLLAVAVFAGYTYDYARVPWLIAAAVIYLIGRGLRYLLAGE